MADTTKIFISYARRDGRELALRLQKDLIASGCEVWLDTSEIEGGASWSVEIEQAIDNCTVGLALLSDGSYRSDVCRGEQLRTLRQGKRVIPLLVKPTADRPVYLEHLNYRDFSDAVKYAEMLTVLQEDITHGEYKPLPERFRHTKFITDAEPRPAHFLERPTVLNKLRDLVMSDSTDRRIGLTAIHGMGGIGKSVMAAVLCHDPLIQDTYPDGVIWITLGRVPGSLTDKFLQIGKALGGSDSDYQRYDQAVSNYRQLISQKAALIVFDDIWSYEHIQPFIIENAPAARIVFTTRDNGIITEVGAVPYRLDILSLTESLDLIASWVGTKREELPSEATTLAKQCGYLPLGLALCGAQLEVGTPYNDLLAALRQAELDLIDPPDIGDLDDPEVFSRVKTERSIRASIKVSIEALRKENSENAIYYERLAILPEDEAMPEAAILTFWTKGNGNDLLRLRRLITTLANRAMITTEGETPNRKVRLHDMQHRYLVSIQASMQSLHSDVIAAYGFKCGGIWSKGPNDGYFFEHLIYHLKHSGQYDELYSLLTDSPKWMEAKYIACIGDRSYVDDLELALKDFDDPLTTKQVLILTKLWIARQVVNARVNLYENMDLRTLTWMGRTDEAIAHAKLRNLPADRVAGLLAIHAALRLRNVPDVKMLSTLIDLTRTMDDRINTLLSLAEELALTGVSSLSVLEEALVVARSLKDPLRCAYEIGSIATLLAQIGQPANALFVEAFQRSITVFHITETDEQFTNDLAAALILSTRRARLALDNATTELTSILIESTLSNQVMTYDTQRDEKLQILEEELSGLDADKLLTLNRLTRITTDLSSDIMSIEDRAAILHGLSSHIARRTISKYDALVEYLVKILSDDRLGTLAARDKTLCDIMLVIGRAGKQDHLLLEKLETITRLLPQNENKILIMRTLAGAMAYAEHVSHKLFEEVLDLARSQEYIYTTSVSLSRIGIAFAKTGFSSQLIFHEALNEAKNLTDSDDRAAAFEEFTVALGEVNHFDEILPNMLDEAGYYRSWAQKKLSLALARDGNYEKGIQEARQLEETEDQVTSLASIAVLLFQAGHPFQHILDEALQLTHTIKAKYKYVSALSDIAVAQFQVGQSAQRLFEEALKEVQLAEPVFANFAINDLAQALVAADRLNEAFQLANSLEKDFKRPRALRSIGLALARLNRVDEALKVISEIGASDYDDQTLAVITDVLATQCTFARAFKMLSGIELHRSVEKLAGWHEGFELLQPKFTADVLCEASRIVGWHYPQWKAIHTMLVHVVNSDYFSVDS